MHEPAIEHFQSPDVMRFLGRKAHGNFTGELVTSFKDRLRPPQPRPSTAALPLTLRAFGGRAPAPLGTCQPPAPLLRAHGVVHKVPKADLYRLGPAGRLLTSGLFAARAASLRQLLREAA